MSRTVRKILVTSALPYANGSIHLGHLVEYIQTDIWVRFQKMRGHQCYYVCADDAHGTAITLRAEKEGITPDELINKVSVEHQNDFAGFHIEFDNYHSTHSAENKALTKIFYERNRDKNNFVTKKIEQYYDEKEQMFLPDRFIKGMCPKCKTPDQYGDNCENCGATYDATDLLKPYSVVSGEKPLLKPSEHIFFKLSKAQGMLEKWTQSGALQTSIAKKVSEWFKGEGLRDWDITRDAPYFGFEIPDVPGKYFYVWFDAPIGYMASFKQLCDRHDDLNFDDYWDKNSQNEVYHFIGKDIVNHHTLFWPAMLEGADFRQPTAVFVHGYLTVNNSKMSKSRGTFVKASTYLVHLNPEYLRYYYAAKLGSGIEDLDLNLADFAARVNADLVGKVVNIASRCAGFINKRFDGRLADQLDDFSGEASLYESCLTDGKAVAQQYEARDFGLAMRTITHMADRINQYIDEQKPWVIAKQEGQDRQLHLVCTTGLNLFRLLMIYLKPVLPEMAKNVENFLNDELTWDNDASLKPFLNHKINKFKPLMTRVEKDKIDAMISASKEDLMAADTSIQTTPPSSAETTLDEPLAPTIEYPDFAKLDLRVARITAAEIIPHADKLLKLTLDLGGLTKQVFAGIKAAYTPEQLVGQLTVMVANLAPRKMRFGLSEGMVLAAGPGGEQLWLLHPDAGAKPGMRIK